MTPEQNKNLETMQSLGIDIMKLTYDECVSELIDKYIEASMTCEYSEEERFRLELDRIKRPTN